MNVLSKIFHSLTKRLVKMAAARLPASERARYKEEWEAHIAESPTIWSRLAVAVGIYLSARRLASVLTLAEGISKGISTQLRQENLYRGPQKIEPKIVVNVTGGQFGGFLHSLVSNGGPELSVEVKNPRPPRLDREELAKQLKLTEEKFPLHFTGILPRGTAAHVFDLDALDLLAEKRNGLSLLDLAGAEIELTDRLGRPVGIVLESGLKGNDRERVLAQAEPI